MEKLIEQGIHPDGVQWRIRKIDDYYYYSENISHWEYDTKRWEWRVIDIHFDLSTLRATVERYAREKAEYIKFMKKRSANDDCSC